MMRQRKIGSRPVGAMGLGCMNLSHAYGHPPERGDAIRLLHRAYDIGVRHSILIQQNFNRQEDE